MKSFKKNFFLEYYKINEKGMFQGKFLKLGEIDKNYTTIKPNSMFSCC